MACLQKEIWKTNNNDPLGSSRVEGRLVFVCTLWGCLKFLPYTYILLKFEN